MSVLLQHAKPFNFVRPEVPTVVLFRLPGSLSAPRKGRLVGVDAEAGWVRVEWLDYARPGRPEQCCHFKDMRAEQVVETYESEVWY